jgi:hypothetical protein
MLNDKNYNNPFVKFDNSPNEIAQVESIIKSEANKYAKNPTDLALLNNIDQLHKKIRERGIQDQISNPCWELLQCLTIFKERNPQPNKLPRLAETLLAELNKGKPKQALVGGYRQKA